MAPCVTISHHFASRIVKGEWYLGGEQRNLGDSAICDVLYDSSAKCQTHLKSSSGGYYEVRLSSVMTPTDRTVTEILTISFCFL